MPKELKAIVLIQQNTTLFICDFYLQYEEGDTNDDFISTCTFHFEERVSEPYRVAAHTMLNYFENDIGDDFEIREIIQLQ